MRPPPPRRRRGLPRGECGPPGPGSHPLLTGSAGLPWNRLPPICPAPSPSRGCPFLLSPFHPCPLSTPVPFPSLSPFHPCPLLATLTGRLVSLSRRLRAFPLPIGSSAADAALDPARTPFPGSRSHQHGLRPWDPVPEHRGSPASLGSLGVPPQPGQGVLWAGSFLLRLLRAFPVLYITMMLENIVLQ